METLAALQIIGERNTGKSLFAHAVAQLWRDGPPTSAVEAFSQFNGRLADCPFIFGDEGFPTMKHGQMSFSQALRALVSRTSIDVEKKGQMPTTARGAVRLCFAANDPEALTLREEFHGDDIAAIAERFYRFHVDSTKIDAIAPRTDPNDPESERDWGNLPRAIVDGMASHVAYLAGKITPTQAGRFWIKDLSGDVSSDLHGRAEDPWHNLIDDALENGAGPQPNLAVTTTPCPHIPPKTQEVTTEVILDVVLNIDAKDRTKSAVMHVARVLRELGFKRGRGHDGSKRVRVFHRQLSPLSSGAKPLIDKEGNPAVFVDKAGNQYDKASKYILPPTPAAIAAASPQAPAAAPPWIPQPAPQWVQAPPQPAPAWIQQPAQAWAGPPRFSEVGQATTEVGQARGEVGQVGPAGWIENHPINSTRINNN